MSRKMGWSQFLQQLSLLKHGDFESPLGGDAVLKYRFTFLWCGIRMQAIDQFLWIAL